MGKKAVKTNEKSLKNNRTTLKITHSFTYCLRIKDCIAEPCLPGNFVGLRLSFDVPEQIAPYPLLTRSLSQCYAMKCSGKCEQKIAK